jgi:hypothetical protein
MPIGFERGERVADVLSGAGIPLRALKGDPVVPVQHAPTD